MTYNYKCNNCGKIFKASGSRAHYGAYTIKTLNSILNLWEYLFSPCWYLCDDCTKRSGIDKLFREDKT